MRFDTPIRGGSRARARSTSLALLLLAACGGGDGPSGPPLGDERLTVAYSYAPANDVSTMEIWVMTEDGGTRRQLTKLPGADRAAAWSPDGAQVAFVHQASLSTEQTLMAINADGTGARTIHSGAPQLTEPTWSPQGDRLAVFYLIDPFDVGIGVIGADGSGYAPVAGTEGATGSASWSPAGDRLLFTRGGSLWLVDAAGGTPQQIAAGASGGQYSPDGARLAALAAGAIVVLNADGTGRTTVVPSTFSGGTVIGDVAWSPDGTRLIFFGRIGTGAGASFDLFTVPVAGGTPRNVTRTAGRFELEPDWR